MTDQMGTPPPAGAPTNRRNIMIWVVVGAIVLCCCGVVAVGVPLAWSCGDMLMGVATECSPLF